MQKTQDCPQSFQVDQISKKIYLEISAGTCWEQVNISRGNGRAVQGGDFRGRQGEQSEHDEQGEDHDKGPPHAQPAAATRGGHQPT